MTDTGDYGLWSLVIINSAVFIVFAFSFTKPKTPRDWRSLGTFSAFIVALFTEMYGFPLTIYLFSGWLQTQFPGTDFLSHDSGHLWSTMLGRGVNPHFNVLHIASNLVVVAGLLMLASAWRVLHMAQQQGELAVTGLYEKIRHPQYVGFILIMFGFLLQWPTLPTLIMFPILCWIYVRLAAREEQLALAEFGEQYQRYRDRTSGFIPV